MISKSKPKRPIITSKPKKQNPNYLRDREPEHAPFPQHVHSDPVSDLTSRVQSINITGDANTSPVEPDIVEERPPCQQGETTNRRQYYLHIDLRNVGTFGSRTGSLINKYMVRNGYFDPRKSSMFLDEVLDEDENLDDCTLVYLREIARVSSSYYEFWCVRNSFDIGHFSSYLRREIEWSIRISVFKIIDNEIERFLFTF